MKFKILLFILFTSINLFAQESVLKEIDFRSKYLNESRKVTIYLAENFNSKKKYNVIFCTDGQFINRDYQNKLDSLFTTLTVKPFVIIGAHSNEKEIPNTYFSYRNYEYVEDFTETVDIDLSNRFQNHLQFFVNELQDSISKRISLKVKHKYFYGVSNGAGFGVNMAKRYPKLFDKFFVYSIAGEKLKNNKWNMTNYPFFVIRYGDKENSVLVENNILFSEYLKNNNYSNSFHPYSGAHKREDWLKQFIKDVREFLQ